MKKSLLILVVFFALAQMSFVSQKAVLPAPVEKRSGMKGPVTTFTENLVVPFSAEIFIACANNGAGDLVQFEGELHELVHVTINNNAAIVKVHDNPQGLSAVGLNSGRKYQATGVSQRQFKASSRNGQYEETYVNNFRIIGQGPGNNFIVHETFHIAFNATGIQTVSVDDITVDCK